MPKVSIIIPVFNAEKYLEKCLDSVVSQTMQDIEILCVNDCSTDNSLKILEKYKKVDSRVKIINHEINGGESKARNTGLANATGEYISFLDNDDTYDVDFLEKLYSKAKETNSDVCRGSVRTYEYDGKITYDNINNLYKKTNNKMTFILNWWTAIYKKDFLEKHNIKLLEGCVLGGDSLFLNNVMLYANGFQYVDDVYYNYYRREDSGDSKILTIEKLSSALDIFEKIINNTNLAYENNIINKYEYYYVFKHWFYSIITISFRNDSIENKRLCANTAFKLAGKCLTKDVFEIDLKRDFNSIFNIIKDKNSEILTNFLFEHNTPIKLKIYDMRKKHKENLEKINA